MRLKQNLDYPPWDPLESIPRSQRNLMRRKALRLREDGFSFARIAEELDIYHENNARRLISETVGVA